MKEIQTVAELTDSLRAAQLKEFPSIIKSCNLDFDDCEAFASWNKKNYSRNCLEKNDRFEIILLCWNPGHSTPIHDHGGQRCWVYQLLGEIEEIRFKLTDNEPEETYRHVLKEKGLSYIDDKMGCHILSNNSGEKSMSIHIYASPIETCDVYNPDSGQFESKDLSFNTIHTNQLEVKSY